MKAALKGVQGPYEAAIRARYVRYFAERSHLRHSDAKRPYFAKDLRSAFPDGWGHLAGYLDGKLHTWGLSGRSSQVLCVGLLGSVCERDPALLFKPRGPMPDIGEIEKWVPEDELDESVLSEKKPRVTALDFFFSSADAVMAVEAKWAEHEIGVCSCKAKAKAKAKGDCTHSIRHERPYWAYARDYFGLDGPPPVGGVAAPGFCGLSWTYQAVRNVAAAVRLAEINGKSRAVWVLLYDDNNPAFIGSGDWPGWPALLAETLAPAAPRLTFAAVSWQEVLRRVPLDPAVELWAREKHGLVAVSQRPAS